MAASKRKPGRVQGRTLLRHRVKRAVKRIFGKRRAPAHVAAKRVHRERLSAHAHRHWRLKGQRERRAYLERVRRALEAEGFRHTHLQWRHKGHSFGLVKDAGDKQIHVRVYDNGLVDAEVEIHRRYVQHLYSPRPSAHRTVQRIFAKHHIPVNLINEHYLPKVGATRTWHPKGRTRVAHVLGSAAGILGSAVAASVARLALRRLKGGRL